jgi:SAM-dependent methyltransferase
MANPWIIDAVLSAWSSEAVPRKRVLDLSCGRGQTAEMLADLGFEVVATGYLPPPLMSSEILRVGGVDLNSPLPFRSTSFDGVDLVEVIEHIENQPQLIREIHRVLKPGGVVVLSTPNILNVMSRFRFLFTGFMRGRVRPVHYSRKPGVAPNIYLLHFYELYYLLFHYDLQIVQLGKTKVKFACRLLACLCWPFMWLVSLVAVIRAEKDPIQRKCNWQILAYFFHPAVLLSDNLVVKAQKKAHREDRPRS